MNKAKWNALPPEEQKIFTDVGKEFVEKYAVGFNNIDIEGRNFFIKQGGKDITLTEAEAPNG